MSFIDDGYELPQSGGAGGQYLNPSKLPDGQPYRIRVMSDKAIKGWEYWTQENKPVRLPYDQAKPGNGKPQTPPADIRLNDEGKPDRIKHFWAMVVWDYQDEALKVFSVTQASILESLLTLIRDEDWGHPKGYDLKITRSGKQLDTSYQVAPGKQGEPPAEAIAALAATPINLAALLEGGDPFNPGALSPSELRDAAIANLKLAAKTAGFDTPAKLKGKLAEIGYKINAIDELSLEEIGDFIDIFSNMTAADEPW